MTEVVDLTQHRMRKALDVAVKEGEASGTVAVQLIACATCNGAIFHLSHDNRIICTGCQTFILPLRWYHDDGPKRAG